MNDYGCNTSNLDGCANKLGSFGIDMSSLLNLRSFISHLGSLHEIWAGL